MAHAHISIAGTPDGAGLQQFRDAIKLVVEQGPALKAKMDAAIEGDATPPDGQTPAAGYDYMETLFGLPVGTGYALWNQHAQVVAALKANPAEAGSTAGDAALLATKLKQYVDQVG